MKLNKMAIVLLLGLGLIGPCMADGRHEKERKHGRRPQATTSVKIVAFNDFLNASE